MSLSTRIVDFEQDYYKDSNGFKMGKIYICYEGDNRNHSRLSKKTIEEMAKGIFGIPIVGKYNKDREDFEAHNSYIKFNDDGTMEIGKDTRPYGFVPESAELNWEYVAHGDKGDVKEYLTVTAVFWTGEYPEVNRIFEGKNNHSMEIEVLDSDWNDDGIMDILEAKFTALCILGEEVEPCFEDAKIVAYSKEFSNELAKMKSEFSLFKKGDVDLKKKKFQEDVVQDDVTATPEGDTEDKTGEASVSADEGKEGDTEPVKDVTDVTEDVAVTEEPVATVEPVVEPVSDFTENDGAGVDISALLGDLADVKKQMAEMKAEYEYLKEFKAQKELEEFEAYKAEAMEKYSSLLTKDVITSTFESVEGMNRDEIESKLAREYTNQVLGKTEKEKKSKEEFSFGTVNKKTKSNDLGIYGL